MSVPEADARLRSHGALSRLAKLVQIIPDLMFTLGSALAAGPCTTGAFCQQHDDFASPAPSWATVQVVDTFGYTRVTVVNATHMKVQAINYVNDSAFDEFWLEAP